MEAYDIMTSETSRQLSSRKRKTMLVRLLAIIALVTVATFVIQNVIIITDVRQQTVQSNIMDINEIASSYIASTGLYVEGTMNELDVYTKSDVVVNGGSKEEIGEWLATTAGRRPDCFQYVLFIAADGNSYYDSGKRGNHSERGYYKRIIAGEEQVVNNPTVEKPPARSA